MSTQTDIPATAPLVVMTRLYDAPRETVWEASTDPRHLRKWWGGPGVVTLACEMDLRPGGRWHHEMRFPNGDEIALDFIFLEIERPSRLVWEHDKARLRQGAPFVHTVVTFEDVGGKTRWRMVARFVSLKDREAALGWGFSRPIEASNDALARYLKSL